MFLDVLLLLATMYYIAGTATIVALCVFAQQSPIVQALAGHGKVVPLEMLPWQRVPKRLFGAFYVFGAVFALAALLHGPTGPLRVLLLHLVRRAVECAAWPHSPRSTMHAVHLLVGLSYYPILVLVFWAAGGTARMSALCIFAAASVFQSHVHGTLRAMRVSRAEYTPLTTRPLFRYLLCPHYTAEIAIHVSFMLMLARCQVSNVALLPWLNLAFVAANLASSAADTYAWHVGTFPNAPRAEYVLFPGLW